jgi:hypothetical protein
MNTTTKRKLAAAAAAAAASLHVVDDEADFLPDAPVVCVRGN